jgi:protein-S-isoprenylcysteine O-methyltransferase Ste14
VTQQFKQRQFPAGNPLANALVIVVGAVVIAVSFVLGVVAFVALASAVLVMAAIIGVRLWWLNRNMGAGRKDPVNRSGKSAAGTEIIEGEFRVIRPRKDSDSTQ